MLLAPPGHAFYDESKRKNGPERYRTSLLMKGEGHESSQSTE